MYLLSNTEVKIKHNSAPMYLVNRVWAWIKQDHSADLLHILSQWSVLSSCSAQTDAVISFSPGLPAATTACQRPEAYLTALHWALQAAGVSDCCNMLHISLGTHTEYNDHQVPPQSLAMRHPWSLLVRWNEQCAICHVAWLHTRPGK